MKNYGNDSERACRTAPSRCFNGGRMPGPIVGMDTPRRSVFKPLAFGGFMLAVTAYLVVGVFS